MSADVINGTICPVCIACLTYVYVLNVVYGVVHSSVSHSSPLIIENCHANISLLYSVRVIHA